MSKYTKDEWLIEGNEIMTNHWKMIVKLPDDYSKLNQEEQANAQLIASAPELLEKLKMAVAWLKNTQAREDRAPRGLCEYNPLGDLEQVISKAEGGVKC